MDSNINCKLATCSQKQKTMLPSRRYNSMSPVGRQSLQFYNDFINWWALANIFPYWQRNPSDGSPVDNDTLFIAYLRQQDQDSYWLRSCERRSSIASSIISRPLRDLPLHHRLWRGHGRPEHWAFPHPDSAQVEWTENEWVFWHRPTTCWVPVQQYLVKVRRGLSKKDYLVKKGRTTSLSWWPTSR